MSWAILISLILGTTLLSLGQHRLFLRHPVIQKDRKVRARLKLCSRLSGGLSFATSLWLSAYTTDPGLVLTEWLGWFALSALFIATLLSIVSVRASYL